MYSTNYTATGAALFVDIENVISHCSTSGLQLDMDPVCGKVKEIAPLRYRKAFGDIPKTMACIGMSHKIVEIRRNLSANMVQIYDIPYVTQYKNSSDIHLALDALALAYDNPHIDHFAFMTIDRDFVPLYNKLKEMGKTIIIISPDEKYTSENVKAAADHLYYYERLVDGNWHDLGYLGNASDIAGLRRQYINLLIRICENMALDGQIIKGSALMLRARQQLADFDYKRAGYLKFKDLLLDMATKGYISLYEPEAGDISIEFLQGAKEGEADAADLPDDSSPEAICDMYRQVLEARLKSPLPSREYRQIAFAVFEQTHAAGISLREWSEKATPVIRSEAANKGLEDLAHMAMPFKMLLTLFFGRAFRVDINPMDKNNPIIHAFAAEPPELEEFLLRNYTSVLRQNYASLDPNVLALLFFNQANEDSVAACNRILTAAGIA